MARTDGRLSPTDVTAVKQLNALSNNTAVYKNNSGAFAGAAIGAAGTVLTSNGATSAPTWEVGGGGTPTAITVANEATDTTCFPAFFTAATGDLGPKTNAGLTFDSNTSTLGITRGLIGTDANFTDFPLAKFIASQANTGHTYAGPVGIVGEANSDASNIGVGVGGIAKTSSAQSARGVVGVGKVNATSDAQPSVGGYFRAEDTHAGGVNVGVSCRAVNGAENYALSLAGGDVSSLTNSLSWLLYDNQSSALTFSSTGKSDILKFITTDGAEGVSMSGTLDVNGQLTLGIDAATNTAGVIKMFAAGANDYYNTFTSGENTANATYTLPVAMPAVTGYVLSCTDAGVMSWAAAGGLSWGGSVTGTSSTGLLVTIGDSADTGTIGQSIVAGNTQTNAVTLLNLDTGTANTSNVGIKVTGSRGKMIVTSGPTTAINDYYGVYHRSGNTNSTQYSYGIYQVIQQNTGMGYNTGIHIQNQSTELLTGSTVAAGVGISLYQTGVGGTSIALITYSNINSSTNGLVNYTLSNTQSGATVMQKIDTGTSAQGHTAYLANIVNASTSISGFSAALSSTGTGTAFKATSSILAGGEQLLNLAHTASGTLTACTVDKGTIASSRTHTAATSVTDNYNVLTLSRTNVNTNAGGTLLAQGAILNITNTATPTAGTLTDTVDLLKITQDTDSTGKLITGLAGATERFKVDPLVANSGTNNAYLFDTTTSLSGTTTLAVFANGGTTKAYIDNAGIIYADTNKRVACGGGSTGAGTTPSGTVTLEINGVSYYLLTSAGA